MNSEKQSRFRGKVISSVRIESSLIAAKNAIDKPHVSAKSSRIEEYEGKENQWESLSTLHQQFILTKQGLGSSI